MSSPPALRCGRHGERGLTLIELLVTIAVMAIAFVALVGAFANTEKLIGNSKDVAQLTSFAGAVGTIMQSEAFPYVYCSGPAGQAPSGTTAYLTAIPATLKADGLNMVGNAYVTGGYHDTVSAIAVAQASSHTSTLPVYSSCSSAGTGSGADYGVQQIKYTVTDSATGESLVRTVYKRWN